jgi:hypothetical protein
MISRRRFRRDRHGRFRTGLGTDERALLKALPGRTLELLEMHDPSVARVFPVAYPQEARAESDYRQMMGAHLLHRHRLALETLEATADAQSLEEEQIHQWLDALEVLRLVLGTQLDVTEDTIPMEKSDPLAPQAAAYRYLSMLQEEIVDSLAQALPPSGDQGGEGGPT